MSAGAYGMNNREDPSVITVVGQIPKEILPQAKEACLVMLYGPDLGKRYPLINLSHTPLDIGRSEHAKIYVDRDSVSRKHAEVFMRGNHYYVRDAGSTNGTYVNDSLVEEAMLGDGDRIKIGEVIFKFLSQNNLENIYHEELYRLATTDGLTTVHNKRYFIDCLEREFSRSRRHNRHLSLVIMDIDFFKKLNDTYGHLAGDYVLKRTARLLRDGIRCEDVFARYGGEEFALLLPETEHWQALQIAEKLRQRIEAQEVFFDGMRLRVTLSLGAALVTEEMLNPEQLIQTADSHLYHAKRSGRNRVCGWSS